MITTRKQFFGAIGAAVFGLKTKPPVKQSSGMVFLEARLETDLSGGPKLQRSSYGPVDAFTNLPARLGCRSPRLQALSEWRAEILKES